MREISRKAPVRARGSALTQLNEALALFASVFSSEPGLSIACSELEPIISTEAPPLSLRDPARASRP